VRRVEGQNIILISWKNLVRPAEVLYVKGGKEVGREGKEKGKIK